MTSTWHNVCVYYADNQDDLVLDCIRPLFGGLGQRPRFFVRHWLRGPHVRLRVLETTDCFDRAVMPVITDQVGGWLATHPSMACLDESELLAVHEWLARRERELGPLSPFYPDNSIQRLPCDRRIDVLGSEAAASLLEDFYVDTNELVFAMLEHIRGGANRLSLALDLMWATAHGPRSSITRGYVSYRSHTEAKIMTAEDPEALRSFFAEHYRTRAPALIERLGQVLATLDGHGGDVPFVRDWAQAMNRLRRRAWPLLDSGDLTLPTSSPGVWFNDEVTAHSAFHQALAANPAFLEMMRTSQGFHLYRVVINCLYLHLTRLGITPFERSLLGYLAAETVEERFGVSAIDHVLAVR